MAKLFNLYITSIDIISSDVTKPLYENWAIINDVNFPSLYVRGDILEATISIFLKDFIKDDGHIIIKVFIGDDLALDKALEL